jgi:hypothetical protein
MLVFTFNHLESLWMIVKHTHQLVKTSNKFAALLCTEMCQYYESEDKRMKIFK